MTTDDATDGAGAVAKETRASSGEAGGSEDLLRVAMKHTFDVHNTSEGTDNLTVTMEVCVCLRFFVCSGGRGRAGGGI